MSRGRAGYKIALALVLGAAPAQAETFAMIAVPGAMVAVGDAGGGEAVRTEKVAPFTLMRTEVTNAAFARFVAATGTRTDAERDGAGWVWNGRWRRVGGADWRHPFGPETTIAGHDDYPVVQVSAKDAARFCAYRGLRLPTEAEWMAAAGAADGRTYPWGEAPPEDAAGRRRANFGSLACCAADDTDGFRTTAPVGRFPSGASPFGALDMAGNVWEWTASRDAKTGEAILKGGGWGNDPWCLRLAYRHRNPPTIGLDHVGFRCAGE